jgi:hypothetical protein
MGLRLPSRRMRSKILYTAIELVLLVITFWLDRRTGSFSLLGIIIAIRSCLIFQQTGRLVVAGLVFIRLVVYLPELLLVASQKACLFAQQTHKNVAA